MSAHIFLLKSGDILRKLTLNVVDITFPKRIMISLVLPFRLHEHKLWPQRQCSKQCQFCSSCRKINVLKVFKYCIQRIWLFIVRALQECQYTFAGEVELCFSLTVPCDLFILHFTYCVRCDIAYGICNFRDWQWELNHWFISRIMKSLNITLKMPLILSGMTRTSQTTSFCFFKARKHLRH